MTRQGSLLVVDDNEPNRDALSRRLRQRGYLVNMAADGREALALVETGQYDLILLDVEMPEMSGLDVLRQLRLEWSDTELPVIMVTARTQGADVVEALGWGANDYVTKPIDFPVALARISTHLSRKWAVGDLRVSEERYALAMRGANDALWDWNLTTNEVHWSSRWKEMLGYGDTEIGVSPDEWFNRVHPEDIGHVRAALSAHLSDGSDHYESEHRVIQRNGAFRWMSCRGAAVRNSVGVATRLAGSFSDISNAKLTDPLTGLPNRLLFHDLLERAIKRAERHKASTFALFVLGLDRLQVDTVKVDRSFVSRIGDEAGREMVQAIVTLAHNLGMDVVAEGVQTADQSAQLVAVGCESAQGFYFSKAVDAAEADLLIAAQPWQHGFELATR